MYTAAALYRVFLDGFLFSLFAVHKPHYLDLKTNFKGASSLFTLHYTYITSLVVLYIYKYWIL